MSWLTDHMPRPECREVFWETLPGRVAAGTPVVLILMAVMFRLSKAKLGLVGGSATWLACSAAAWWMAFRSVERALDRVEDHGLDGLLERRRRALTETLPIAGSFLAGMMFVFGCLLLLAKIGLRARNAEDFGVLLTFFLGPPFLLLAPFVAARALLRRRLLGEDVGTCLWDAALEPLRAAFRIPGRLLGLVPRQPEDLEELEQGMDMQAVFSPLAHGFYGGFFFFMAMVMSSYDHIVGPILPVLLVTIDLQHELEVLTHSFAQREAVRALPEDPA